MRIAIITKSFPLSHNDWSMPPLIDFVRSIADEIEIDVYALYYPYERRSYRIFGTQVHSFDLGRPNRFLRWICIGQIRKKFAQAHAANPYHLIHAIWADTPATVAARLSSDLEIPMIMTFYAGEAVRVPEIAYGSLRKPKDHLALNNALDHSTVSTCGSQQLSAEIARITDHMPRVSPFGLCDELFAPGPTKTTLEGTIRIITAASFSAVKGLDVLLDAFRAFTQEHPALAKGVHWHVIGPDAGNRVLRTAMKKQILDLPITVHDAKPHWEMPDFYRAGDLAWHGSWFESQCFAAMEPAACGIPVAGSAVGVIPEMASPDWTCTPGDPQALKNLLVHVLSHRAEWADQARRQRAWVQDNATLTVAARRFKEIYSETARI